MSARKAGRPDKAAETSKPRKSPPARIRNYRIEAELRDTPDLHKLAQVFIGMALARADAERHQQLGTAGHPPQSPFTPRATTGKTPD